MILAKTIVGRYAFSIGSNEAATALSGVNVVRWKIILYSMSGLFVGIAGVLAASRLSSAQPVGGMGLELEAIAAVVIGGTSLQGGKGSIVGTVVGALIVAVLTNGLRVTALPQEWQSVAVGCVDALAVYFDLGTRRRRRRRTDSVVPLRSPAQGTTRASHRTFANAANAESCHGAARPALHGSIESKELRT